MQQEGMVEPYRGVPLQSAPPQVQFTLHKSTIKISLASRLWNTFDSKLFGIEIVTNDIFGKNLDVLFFFISVKLFFIYFTYQRQFLNEVLEKRKTWRDLTTQYCFTRMDSKEFNDPARC